jgi:hypothetical protein
MKLNNQEIRNCIYSGTLNDLINGLNKEPDWLKLNRMRKDTGYRFRGQELILRFFALYDNVNNYGGRLATFLNEYMADNRRLDEADLSSKRVIFKDSLNIVFSKIFDSKAPAKLPLSVMEATLVGVAKNLSSLRNEDVDEIKSRYFRMLEDAEFSQEKLNEGLSGRERVKGRIKAAVSSFSIDG